MATARNSQVIHISIISPIDRFVLVDDTNNRIVFFRPDGTIIDTLGFGIRDRNWVSAFWYDGYVRVVNASNSRVHAFDVYGNEDDSRRLDVDFGFWTGGFAHNDIIWLVDDTDGSLRAFNPDDASEFTEMKIIFGSDFEGDGAYEYNGNFYVVESRRDMVIVVNPSGVEQTALSGTIPFSTWVAGLEYAGESYLIDGGDEIRVFNSSWVEQTSKNFALPNDGFEGGFRLTSLAIALAWNTIPAQTIFHATLVDLDLNDYVFGDSDITISTTDTLPDGLTLTDGVLSGTTDDDGIYTITLTATNNEGSETATLNLCVSLGIIAPVWSNISDVTISAGESINLDLNDYVAGGGTIVITASGLPDDVTLSDGVLSGSSLTDIGTHEIEVTATNEAGESSTTFDIEIEGAAPVWSTIPRQIRSVGFTVIFNLNNFVTGTPAPTITATGLPSGLSIQDGIITGQPSIYGQGRTVTATATNAAGSAITEFRFLIRNAGETFSIMSSSGGGVANNYTLSYISQNSVGIVSWQVSTTGNTGSPNPTTGTGTSFSVSNFSGHSGHTITVTATDELGNTDSTTNSW